MLNGGIVKTVVLVVAARVAGRGVRAVVASVDRGGPGGRSGARAALRQVGDHAGDDGRGTAERTAQPGEHVERGRRDARERRKGDVRACRRIAPRRHGHDRADRPRDVRRKHGEVQPAGPGHHAGGLRAAAGPAEVRTRRVRQHGERERPVRRRAEGARPRRGRGHAGTAPKSTRRSSAARSSRRSAAKRPTRIATAR